MQLIIWGVNKAVFENEGLWLCLEGHMLTLTGIIKILNFLAIFQFHA